jgi:hypothetical protein
MTSAVGFLEPQFLWGLLFVGAVLLVHLLKRPRTVRLSFSTLRFFDESAVTKTRSRAVKKLLLLLVRILMVITIITIFALPFCKNDPLRIIHDPTSDLFVWIDPTPSMQYRENGVSITDKARRTIDSITELRPDRSRVFLYNEKQAGFVPYAADSSLSTAALFINAQRLEQACIRAMHTTHRPLLIIMSDFQSPTTAMIEALVSKNTADAATVLYLPLTPDAPWNCTIDDVRVVAGSEPLLRAHIVSSGNRRCTGTLSASIDNMRSPPQTCILPSGADTVISVPAPRAIQSGWGSITLQCDDPLPFDNTALFIAGEHGTTTVCIVGNRPESYPLAAAIGAVGSSMSTSITTCTHETFSIEQCRRADIVFVNGGQGALRTMQIIRQTHPSKKQAIITAYDSLLTAGASARWKRAASPLVARLTDTISGFWKDFPSLRCDEIKVYGYRSDLTGIPLLSLANGTPLCTFTDDKKDNRALMSIATPLGISSHNNFCETAFYVPFIDRLLRAARMELAQRHTPWIAGVLIKNPWYGHHKPVPVLDAGVYGGGKQVMALQQQPFFVIASPGMYKVVPPDASSYFKIVAIDSLEGKLDYRTPAINKNDKRARIIISPHELLAYCKSHRRSVSWIIPWLLFAVLYFSELLLRQDPAGLRKKIQP